MQKKSLKIKVALQVPKGCFRSKLVEIGLKLGRLRLRPAPKLGDVSGVEPRPSSSLQHDFSTSGLTFRAHRDLKIIRHVTALCTASAIGT